MRIVGGCWDCYHCFLWQHMPVTGKKLKMRPKGKLSGLTPGAGDTAINRYLDWVSGEIEPITL